jgi:1,2-diacylglycerol 3-alpha-glucosyltransferase
MDYRKAYGLPERYFLSLGRMVEKKNLATLVAAYGRYCDEWREPECAEIGRRGDQTSDESARQGPVSLVFVGSGELEGALRKQARVLGLAVVDRSNWKAGQSSETRDSLPAVSHKENCGTVFFYGFRQIEENPVFYSLAEAFVLPSLKEEWGLVVNEAMAAGLPVIVSRTAGCAEDLVPHAKFATGAEVGGLAGTDDCTLTAESSIQASQRPTDTAGSLEQRSNGFVFDPKSCDALATALARAAEMGSRRSEMGQWSREIVANFSCENFAKQALRAAEAAGA